MDTEMYRQKFRVARHRRWRRRNIALALLLSAGLSWGQEEDIRPKVLAKVGDRFITEKEFIERFELTPGIARRPAALAEEKEAVLYSLIAEKLLAAGATDAGEERNLGFQHAFGEIRKLIARDELYRREITGKVAVDRNEILSGVKQARRQLTMSFIFVPQKTDALFLRKQIRSPEDMAKVVIDPSLLAIRDTATIIWGDADWDIERAAYALKPGEVSGVVEAGGGYYMMTILREIPSEYFSSFAPAALQDEVLKTLRLRKERIRLDEFVRKTLKGKRGFAVQRHLRTLAQIVGSVLEQPAFRSDSTLSPETIDAVAARLENRKGDTLAVAGTSVWSVADVLERLRSEPTPIPARDVTTVFGLLNRQLMAWVQQDLLAQEAIRRKLDREPAPAWKLSVWRDAMLAARMKERLTDSIRVTAADVWRYAASVWETRLPWVAIREVWSLTPEGIQSIVETLKSGHSFESLASDSARLQGREPVVKLKINEHPPIGQIAYSMRVGEVYGPVFQNGRYLMFQLAAKDTLTLAEAGISAAQVDTARREMIRMKGQRAVTRFLAAKGKEEGFMGYLDQLARVKVSAVPMMTFRILGFGGRMMEVPFVDRQLEWLKPEEPENPDP